MAHVGWAVLRPLPTRQHGICTGQSPPTLGHDDHLSLYAEAREEMNKCAYLRDGDPMVIQPRNPVGQRPMRVDRTGIAQLSAGPMA